MRICSQPRSRGLGDLDGDGVSDIAVGAEENGVGVPRPGASELGRGRLLGRVHIFFLNADGSIKDSTIIDETSANGPVLADNAYFGFSLANVGDLDGDGVIDLATGEAEGPLRIVHLNVDGSVKATTIVTDVNTGNPFGPPGDRFGYSITNLGDLNGDGVIDLAAGAPEDSTGGQRFGAVYILNLASATIELDFGDAPSAAQSGFPNSYPVTLADDGARHSVVGPMLGQGRDAEADGIPHLTALGDDLDAALNDETGVTFVTSTLIASSADGIGLVDVDVQNPNPSSNRLDAYIDFNRNGVWEADEKIFDDFDLGTTAGTQNLNFVIPGGATPGGTFARFRVSTIGGLGTGGLAADGEVEDHFVTFAGPPVPPITHFTGPAQFPQDPTVTLTWAEARYATTYELRVYHIEQGREIVRQVLTDATSFTFLEPLEGGARYSAYVRVVNEVGSSQYNSLIFTQRPPATLALRPVITGPRSHIRDTTATVTWDDFPDATDYRVLLYSVNRGKELVRQQVGNVTQFETPTLARNERYQVFVEATTSSGQRSLSSPRVLQCATDRSADLHRDAFCRNAGWSICLYTRDRGYHRLRNTGVRQGRR